MAARATARVRRRECSDAGRRANTWRSTCQQRYRWHLEKNATQTMPAIGVVAYGMILCPLSSEMPPACDQASVYLSRQPRQPRRPTGPRQLVCWRSQLVRKPPAAVSLAGGVGRGSSATRPQQFMDASTAATVTPHRPEIRGLCCQKRGPKSHSLRGAGGDGVGVPGMAPSWSR